MGKYHILNGFYVLSREKKIAGSKAYIDCMTGFLCVFLIIEKIHFVKVLKLLFSSYANIGTI